MIINHARKYNSSIDLDNLNIIGRMDNLIDLRSLESLYIFKLKPQLNESQRALQLSFVNR